MFGAAGIKHNTHNLIIFFRLSLPLSMATDKQDLLSQITVSKSDLAKAIVTGDKKLIETVSVVQIFKCGTADMLFFSQTELCTILLHS